ncbi:sugar phosphate isomerase/epimerase family protein [Mycolicibacterium peregrinum]|uniref:sugar phosphate isomerase/epimerase family protein n=1 Tax=Mycolicibacterium peregrinum TaxID=43304 RepID=UPI000A688CEF|nr:sugar phosphate isomerase/epimerase [Mycolicibacterium peregrinum]
MTAPLLVATAWTSAGAASPMAGPAVSPVPITERVAAVADAGFVGLGLIADDLAVIRESIGFKALRDLIADAGLTHTEIELIERWWIPRGQPGNSHAVRDLLFEAADVLHPAFIKIGSEPGPRTPHPEALVEPLRELADQAAAHGTRIAIETMPFSIIDTVPFGAELIRAAGHPVVGLLVDAWHVFRAGTTLDELAAVAPEKIFGVELDDAAAHVVGTLFEDTVNNRLLCGEGTFDLTGLIVTLRSLGFDGPWGVEILSDSFRALPVHDGLKQAAESAVSVLRPGNGA